MGILYHTLSKKYIGYLFICIYTSTGISLVTICLPKDIRIEIGADCPAALMAALLQALKSYA